MGDVKDTSDDFMVEDARPAGADLPGGGGDGGAGAQRETDPHRLAQRQKQVDMGKNTLGYQRYLQAVPRERRSRRDPSTPDVHQACSKRAFEGQVKQWRRLLHAFDPPTEEEAAAVGGGSAEAADDFELISHADAAEPMQVGSPASEGRAKNARLPPRGASGGRNSSCSSGLPLKIPSALTHQQEQQRQQQRNKRGYAETVMAGGEENRGPRQQQHHHQKHHHQQAQQRPGAAKQQRRSEKGQGPRASSKGEVTVAATAPLTKPASAAKAAAAARKVVAAVTTVPVAAVAVVPNAPAWAERYCDPELDYGISDAEEEGEDGWQHVGRGEATGAALLPGQYRQIA